MLLILLILEGFELFDVDGFLESGGENGMLRGCDALGWQGKMWMPGADGEASEGRVWLGLLCCYSRSIVIGRQLFYLLLYF